MSKYRGKSTEDERNSSMTMDEAKHRYAELKKPEPPARKRFKVNDATAPKLHEISADNPRGILTWRDELIGLFSHLEKPENSNDKSMYLEGWTGTKPYDQDRIQRGSKNAARLCWAIFGGITPSKLEIYLNKIIHGIDNDGFVQRFQMLIYPDKNTGELIDRAPDESAKNRVFYILKRISELPVLEEIPYLRFNGESQLIFDEWYRDLRKTKLLAQEHPIMIEHLAKYAKLMPSLSLIFHIVHTIDGNTDEEISSICQECTIRAATWCDFLEFHARRVYGTILAPQKAALKLSEKIKEGLLLDGFTIRDVRDNGWSMLTVTESIEGACALLIKKHWLGRKNCLPGQQGGRPTVRYLINPKLKAPVSANE
jgi:hypothetical protein